MGPAVRLRGSPFSGQKSGQRYQAGTSVIVLCWSKQSVVPTQDGDLAGHRSCDNPLGFS